MFSDFHKSMKPNFWVLILKMSLFFSKVSVYKVQKAPQKKKKSEFGANKDMQLFLIF